MWANAIRIAALEAAGKGKSKQLRLAAQKLVSKAVGGDIAAMKEMGDRLDGKPALALEHGATAGGPVIFTMNVLGADDG